MPQYPSDDTTTTFVKGLVTETSELNSQKDAAHALQNMVLRRDGSIKRRKAIEEEASAVAFNGFAQTVNSAFKPYVWKAAGGDPDNNIVVTQIGSTLFFFFDDPALSSNKLPIWFDLLPYKVPLATDLQVANEPVSIANGRGQLVVVGKYTEPLLLKYDNWPDWAAGTAYALGDPIRIEDTVNATFYKAVCIVAGTSHATTEPVWDIGTTPNPTDGTVTWRLLEGESIGSNNITPSYIQIRERDFWGIDDNIGYGTKPPTLTDSHEYNLRNQGWEADKITDFYNDTVAPKYYPAKNMHWYMGYRPPALGVATDTYDPDAPLEWSTAKIDAELFSNTLAPMGSFFNNPFDTTVTNGADLDTTSTLQCTSAADVNGNAMRFYFDTTEFNAIVLAAGSTWIVGDDVQLQGFSIIAYNSPHDGTGRSYCPVDLGNATYPLTVVGDGTTAALSYIQVEIEDHPAFSPLAVIVYDVVKFPILGSVSWGSGDGAGVANPSGRVVDTRFECCAWFAGRMFYSGCSDQDLLGRVFFTQVAVKDRQYGYCFQKNDPTGKSFTALEDDDGGFINLPEIGQIRAMEQVGGELFIFAEQGVWAIGGGQRGYFTAGGYSIRQVTGKECISKNVVNTGSDLIYFGPTGVHLISNQNSALLTDNIQTYWDAIPYACKQKIQACFDENRGLLYVAYPSTTTIGNRLDRILVFDMVLKAWYPYSLDYSATQWLMGLLPIDSADDQDVDNKIKYFCIDNLNYGGGGTASVLVCDSNQTTFTDWTGTEQTAYVETGWNLGADAARRFQAPILHVHCKKTTTGFTDDGLGGLAETNPSSVLLSTKWDFTSNATPGKWTENREVFRNLRAFQPNSAATIDADPLNDDGYPVIITRNKIRGRGRALQMRFTAGTAKDAHILGWANHLKVTRRL